MPVDPHMLKQAVGAYHAPVSHDYGKQNVPEELKNTKATLTPGPGPTSVLDGVDSRLLPAGGAGAGALLGALLTKKKKRRGQNALLGGALGLGLGTGGSYLLDAMKAKSASADKAEVPSNNKPLRVLDAGESTTDVSPKKVGTSHKACSPHEFGMHKAGLSRSAIENSIAKMVTPYVAAAAGRNIGGLAGALGGGAYGAYNPGAYAALDEEGRPIVKRRSRLMGGLRGALGYGVGGALAGGAVGAGAGTAYANAKYGAAKQAGEWTALKSPINWSRILPKSDASAKNWQPSSQTQPAKPASPATPTMKPVNAPPMQTIRKAAEEKVANFDVQSLLKQLQPYATHPATLSALAGAGIGGLGGALTGGRGRRGGAALRGALGGALVGGVGGGVADWAQRNPDTMTYLMNKLRGSVGMSVPYGEFGGQIGPAAPAGRSAPQPQPGLSLPGLNDPASKTQYGVDNLYAANTGGLA